MVIQYDLNRNRLIAGGLDNQLKFFSDDLKLVHKIKLHQPIFTLAVSPDGMHHCLGLVDGSLIIRSRQLEEAKEHMDDDMKMIMNAFTPNAGFVSKAKNYKYFYRG